MYNFPFPICFGEFSVIETDFQRFLENFISTFCFKCDLREIHWMWIWTEKIVKIPRIEKRDDWRSCAMFWRVQTWTYRLKSNIFSSLLQSRGQGESRPKRHTVESIVKKPARNLIKKSGQLTDHIELPMPPMPRTIWQLLNMKFIHFKSEFKNWNAGSCF